MNVLNRSYASRFFCMNAGALAIAVTMGFISMPSFASTPQADGVAPPFGDCARPEWPETAIRPGEAPTVVLAFLVSENGKVVDSRVDISSGFRVFDAAAQEAIAKCIFTPPMENGKPVQGWVTIRYTFSLD